MSTYFDYFKSPHGRLLLEFGAVKVESSRAEQLGKTFSSFLGDTTTCCLAGRVDVVRGNRLLAPDPVPFAMTGSALAPLPSLLEGRYGIPPLIARLCRMS